MKIDNQTKQLLKLYQDISKEVTLAGLSKTVINIVATQVTVSRALIIARTSNKFKVLAEHKTESLIYEKSITAVPSYLPLSVLEQTKREKQPVTLTEKDLQESFFKKDEYLQENKLQKIILFPITNETEEIGLLYLETNTEVDNSQGLFVIEQLLPQISITLQNCLINQAFLKQIANKSKVEKVSSAQKDTEKLNTILESKITLLGEIGQNITESTDLENITEVIYEKINVLLDAYTFDIGIYDALENHIDFLGAVENGKKRSASTVSLNDTERLGVKCVLNQEEIIINDLNQQDSSFISSQKLISKKSQSVIFLPILDKGRVLGVISVQSKEKGAYNQYHVNILRSLAVYLAIAINNNMFKQAREAEVKSHQKQLKEAYETVKLLGEIGQDITSNLEVGKIIETTYENINASMDAKVFSIGIFNAKKNRVDVPSTIENGKKLPAYFYEISDDSKLSVLCLKTRKEIIIQDIDKDFNQYVDTPLPEDTSGLPQSIIYLPLLGKEGTLGIVTIQSFQKNAYSEQDINILRNLAVYMGIALDNALVYEGLEETVQERTAELVQQKDKLEQSFEDVKLLSDIGFQITTTLSSEDIISINYQHINNLMDANIFAIGVINPSKNNIEFRGGIEDGETLPDFDYSLNDKHRYSVWAIQNNKEVFIEDFDTEYNKYIENAPPPNVGSVYPNSVIYMPLSSKDKVIGVITVQSFQKKAYSEYHLNIVRNLAVYTAIAIENAQTYKKIEQKQSEIQKTSEKITSSIKYAKRIQQAMLPNRTLISQILPESFVFFKPRDIVSGDFFWFLDKEDKNKTFIAAVDCTGHGVPGAFMSIIGNQLLNEIIDIREIESPEEVLNLLHQRVKSMLNQNETENRDGMDLALCVIDRANNTLEFAGAKNPLVRIVNDEMEVIKGDKLPIGGISTRNRKTEEESSYTKHTFTLGDGAMYYIFSDGYADQFGGGENERKFMLKHFKQMLFDMHKDPISKQRRTVRRRLNDWMGDEVTQQTDDILVIGFKP